MPSSYAGPTPTVQLASLPPQAGPNAGPALDVFPDAPDARMPEEPAENIVWAAPNTPRGEVDRLIAKYAAYYEVPETPGAPGRQAREQFQSRAPATASIGA